jgi:hypothetical protein
MIQTTTSAGIAQNPVLPAVEFWQEIFQMRKENQRPVHKVTLKEQTGQTTSDKFNQSLYWDVCVNGR